MLSFHEPQSLYAEAGMGAVALLVILYRCCGGSNEWLRTHGLILTAYFALGGVAYDELEGWKLMDSTYFLIVTVTTVGYGDICPITDEGKLFTVVYALLGLIFVFAALSPLLDALLWFKDLLLKPCEPRDPMETDEDGVLDLDDLRSRGNWGWKYYSAIMGPVIVFIIGIALGYGIMDLNTVDGIYWSMITMTTIGYGDISAHNTIQKAVLCIYLPLAVAALADTLSSLEKISTAKSIIDYDADPERLLLAEARGDFGGKVIANPNETLTEAEFLISVLKDKGLVDDLTVQAVRLQFAHIVRYDKSKSDTKALTDKIVFLDLKTKGRIAAKAPGAKTLTPTGAPRASPCCPAPCMPPRCAPSHALCHSQQAAPADGWRRRGCFRVAGETIDLVDTKAADGGYAEWRKTYWIQRVLSRKNDEGETGVRLDQVGVAPPSAGYTRLEEGAAAPPSPPGKQTSPPGKKEKSPMSKKR